MALVEDGKYVKETVDKAVALLDDLKTGVARLAGSNALGMANPSDEELVAFFFQMQVHYPPEMWNYPDGHQVYASEWILQMDYAKNGDEWLGRWERFVRKNGGV